MTRVFVFEYLTGCGAEKADAAGIDALLQPGREMRDAMLADLMQAGDFEITAAATAQAPLEGALASLRTTRPREGEALADFVFREAAAHDVAWVVAPETGGLLAQLHDAVGSARWLGCERQAIACATSKSATLKALAAAGLHTPLAFERALQTQAWVAKPDDGAGALDTKVHPTREAALQDAALRHPAACCVEPWVDGEPLSLSLLCAGARVEILSVNRQIISRGDDGLLSLEAVVNNAVPLSGEWGPALCAVARKVARAVPGLRGFVGIDLVWHPLRGPVVIEVNPRVTSAYVGLSAALGRNLAAELLLAHALAQETNDAAA
jgi:tyramine---L-glutamate ligase